MKTSSKIAERFASAIIGAALAVMGLIFIALGVTVLPVIGILIAFPVMGLAFSCFRPGAWPIAAETETTQESGISEPLAA